MSKIKLAVGMLAVAGLLGSTFTADAKSHKMKKMSKHHSMTTSSKTTGANMKSNRGSSSANPSSSGNVGPGTSNNQGPAPGGR
jgi:hypothetical protein